MPDNDRCLNIFLLFATMMEMMVGDGKDGRSSLDIVGYRWMMLVQCCWTLLDGSDYITAAMW